MKFLSYCCILIRRICDGYFLTAAFTYLQSSNSHNIWTSWILPDHAAQNTIVIYLLVYFMQGGWCTS